MFNSPVAQHKHLIKTKSTIKNNHSIIKDYFNTYKI